MKGRRAAGIVVGVVLAASCGSSSSRSGLRATLEQYRADEVTHILQIQVTNTTARKVRISGLQLVWPGLVAVAPSARADLVGPGQTVDLPVDYGPAVCPATGVPTTTPPIDDAVAAAGARWDDTGKVEPVRIAVRDTRGILARLYLPDCEEQLVTRAVDLAWSPDWTDTVAPDGRAASRGRLTITRRTGTDPVTVTQLRGSVVLNVDPVTPSAPGTPLATLAPEAARLDLDVVISQAGSC